MMPPKAVIEAEKTLSPEMDALHEKVVEARNLWSRGQLSKEEAQKVVDEWNLVCPKSLGHMPIGQGLFEKNI